MELSFSQIQELTVAVKLRFMATLLRKVQPLKRQSKLCPVAEPVPHRTEYYAAERLHPNDLSFAYYARNLIKAVTPHI